MRRGKLKNLLYLTSTAIPLFLFSCGGGGGSIDSSTSLLPTAETKSADTTSVIGQVATTSELASEPTVKLIVDSDKNGLFEEDKDSVYETVARKGEDSLYRFQLLGVEVPEDGAKANILVNAEGYAPYSKVVSLKPRAPLSVSVSLTPTSPPRVVDVNRYRTKAPEGKIYFVLTKSNKIEVYTDSRAITVEDSDLKLSIDLAAIPEDVNRLKISMKTFDSSKPEDLKSFPGEFLGTSPSSEEELVGLESVAFSYIGIKDESNNPISLKALKGDVCLYEVSQKLPESAISTIKEKGDFDPETDGCQVPIYSYNYNSESWSYLGTGTIEEINSCDKLSEGGDYTLRVFEKRAK